MTSHGEVHRLRPVSANQSTAHRCASTVPISYFRPRALVSSTCTVTVTTEVNKCKTPSYPLVNTDPTDRSCATTTSGEIALLGAESAAS
jgi:hypothetical protein